MLVTNLLFLRGFTIIHRAFIRNYVMIFQDLINIFEVLEILLSGKTQITYKSLRNCLYIGNSAFFFEIQAP